MNVSGGISEVLTLNSTNKVEKNYLWPSYNAGKVYRIRPVNPKRANTYYYKKPSEKDHNKLMDQYGTKEITYGASGSKKYTSQLPVKSGNFFDARA